MIQHLPIDCLLHCLQFCTVRELVRLLRVNRLLSFGLISHKLPISTKDVFLQIQPPIYFLGNDIPYLPIVELNQESSIQTFWRRSVWNFAKCVLTIRVWVTTTTVKGDTWLDEAVRTWHSSFGEQQVVRTPEVQLKLTWAEGVSWRTPPTTRSVLAVRLPGTWEEKLDLPCPTTLYWYNGQSTMVEKRVYIGQRCFERWIFQTHTVFPQWEGLHTVVLSGVRLWEPMELAPLIQQASPQLFLRIFRCENLSLGQLAGRWDGTLECDQWSFFTHPTHVRRFHRTKMFRERSPPTVSLTMDVVVVYGITYDHHSFWHMPKIHTLIVKCMLCERMANPFVQCVHIERFVSYSVDQLLFPATTKVIVRNQPPEVVGRIVNAFPRIITFDCC